MSQTGERLRVLRKRAHLTQEDLAREADITVTTVARVELGMSEPRLKTVKRLAQALGVPISDLIDDEDSPDEDQEPAAQPA